MKFKHPELVVGNLKYNDSKDRAIVVATFMTVVFTFMYVVLSNVKVVW